jgi:Tfp pilus assembly protein PilO
MSRIITAFVLLLIAVGLTTTFTQKYMNYANESKAESAEYAEALKQSQNLATLRANLLEQYESIPQEQRDRLEKFLPRNIDTVRLIIEIDSIANRHGLSIGNATFTAEGTALQDLQNQTLDEDQPLEEVSTVNLGPYNEVQMSFSVQSSYENFLSFISDLEQNLRLSDIQSIKISKSEDGLDTYQVTFTTYWLGS